MINNGQNSNGVKVPGFNPHAKDIVFIGVDPGVKGAICTKAYLDLHITTFRTDELERLANKFSNMFPDTEYRILIEEVGPRTKDTPRTAFSFGQSYGELIAFFKHCPVFKNNTTKFVKPQRWQLVAGLPAAHRQWVKTHTRLKSKYDENKEVAFIIAKELFPQDRVRKYAADSILLSHVAQRAFFEL